MPADITADDWIDDEEPTTEMDGLGRTQCHPRILTSHQED
jgi:hypothetical protein